MDEKKLSARELQCLQLGERRAYKKILEELFPAVYSEYFEPEELRFSRYYLRDILIKEIRNLKENLKKARRIYKEQQKQIRNLQQGDLFK